LNTKHTLSALQCPAG